MKTKLLAYLVSRILMIVGLLILISLLAVRVKADDYASFMAGVFMSGVSNLAETKFVNVGHRGELALGLSYQYEVGGWADIAGKGRYSSMYGAYQVGVEAGDSALARVMVGPSIITHPDSYLGGPLEFTEDFFLGIKGNNGNIVGIKYKHFSSGGIYQPNIGRDLTGVEASIRF